MARILLGVTGGVAAYRAIELAAQREFEHVVVNDEIQRAAGELEAIVREELGRDP